MKKNIYIVIFILISFSLSAAPSLLITKPPVTPIPSWTGPVQDPDAINGQWFKDLQTNAETYRTHEFYDNVLGSGGGSSDSQAIHGYAFNVVYAPPGFAGVDPILSFDIFATITNDIPTGSDWSDGSNSHNEQLLFLSTEDQYIGDLYHTKLTAEFALNSSQMQPSQWIAPYRDTTPYIVSVNEDQHAWYCWTPENPEELLQPWGDYYVPTWDFGHISMGASVSRTMQFTIPGGLPSGDNRYIPIYLSSLVGPTSDILVNRTTSLKISTWIDEILADNILLPPYPVEPLRGSNVSVFHNDNEDPPLAVELSSFYGTYINGIPTLYWTTQTEENNEYWNVYRGTNNNFAQALWLNTGNPVPGNGTINTPSDYIYVDTAPVIQNTTYWYWIEDVSTDGESGIHEPITLDIPFDETPPTPDFYGLHQNYPNPFNPSTSISFALEQESDVEVIVYNIKGEKIKTIFNDQVYADQIQIVIWDGKDADGKQVSSGIYLYKLITDTKEYQKKMLLVK